MAAELTITPLSEAGGVVVTGVDASRSLNETVRKELYRLFLRHGLLLLRDQKLTPAQHIEFSRIFGELDVHPIEQVRLEGHPEIIELSNRRRTITPGEEDQVIGRIPWHSDLTYTANPSRGAVLYARVVPEEGGETGFVDTAAVYDCLGDDMKQRLEGLQLIHSAGEMKQSAVRIEPATPRSSGEVFVSKGELAPASFPEVVHPLVVTPPESGRKALNVSPAFARCVSGMGEQESRALLDELIAHATSPRFAYLHSWRVGDMIVWDNWRTLHMASGYKARYLREMHRTTLRTQSAMGCLAA